MREKSKDSCIRVLGLGERAEGRLRGPVPTGVKASAEPTTLIGCRNIPNISAEHHRVHKRLVPLLSTGSFGNQIF